MRTPNKAAVADIAAGPCGARQVQKEELARAIGAVADGDKAAFALVYAATAAKLFGIIVRIVRRRDVAEDVLQEVYLRIWRHAASFDSRFGSPMTWMATIAHRRALDEVRRMDPAIPIEESPEVLRLAMQDGPFAGEEVKFSRDLAAALQRLNPDKRSMLVQAYCYGLTREEIAKRTERPVSTVKTWLRRALAELRVYLAEQETATPVAPMRQAPTPHEGRALALTTRVTPEALSPI